MQFSAQIHITGDWAKIAAHSLAGDSRQAKHVDGVREGDIQLIFGADGDMLDGDNFAALQATGRFKTLISAP
ncbi:MAG: hypothetical protein ACSLEN_03210 [Candidatus Malihini olakiniferum]